MRWLLPVAVVLVVVWVAAKVLGWVVGAALHLLLLAAVVMIAVWLYRKVRQRV